MDPHHQNLTEGTPAVINRLGGELLVIADFPPEANSKPSMSRTAEESVASQGARGLLVDRFRCRPDDLADFLESTQLSEDPGYFRFGPRVIGYGRCTSPVLAGPVTDALHDVRGQVFTEDGVVRLPIDPIEVIDNLRCERYLAKATGKPLPANKLFRNTYYLVRPLMPVALRKHIQRLYFRGRQNTPFPRWPVDRTVEAFFEQLLLLSMKAQGQTSVPFIWYWPEGARSCSMVTHDVETAEGVDFCSQLMDLTASFGIRSSFQVVPEKRYRIPELLLRSIRERGFEVNVHDLNHDGHLFSNREEFLRRAKRINHYAREFGALGFRSAVMYRNIDWYDALEVSYDMSIPNVAHLDPQQGGCCTVLPFFIGKILELPVTLSQDYTLFHILNDYSTRLWKEQIALIREQHGLISVIIHPDYIIDPSAWKIYAELLGYLSELQAQRETWIALPNQVARWWRQRSAMHLVRTGNSWRIEGAGSERARVAYAVADGHDRLRYEFD